MIATTPTAVDANQSTLARQKTREVLPETRRNACESSRPNL